MDRRIAALTFALTLACFSDEPPEVVSDEGGAMPDVPPDVPEDVQVSFVDACVEVLSAAAAGDCAESCDYSWCHVDVCMSMTSGEVLDACAGISVVGDPSFARAELDACVSEVVSCGLIGPGGAGGLCSPGASNECMRACEGLEIIAACLESETCSCYACGGVDCAWGTGTG